MTSQGTDIYDKAPKGRYKGVEGGWLEIWLAGKSLPSFGSRPESRDHSSYFIVRFGFP